MNRKGNRGFADTEKLNRIGLSNWSFQWRTTAQCLNMAICISTLLVLYETAAGQPNQQLSIRTGISGLSSEFQREHRVVTPYNARSCAECHSTPKIGGSSPVTVIRAGDRIVGRYDGVGESVTIHKHGETGRPHDPQIMKLRVALNLLGDGYVEAVPDRDLQAIAKSQVVRTHGVVRGQAPLVTVLHATDAKKAEGRFGWKDQHASLLSAAADALNNELGVPNRYFPADLAGNAAESSDNDSELFSLVSFIRSTEPVAPDRSAALGNPRKPAPKYLTE